MRLCGMGAVVGAALVLACVASGVIAGEAAAQTADSKVLIYTGTVAHRHSEAINAGIGPVQEALAAAGIESDWEDCNGYGTAAGQCQNADANPRVFTAENLEQYDALFFFNAGGDDGRSGAAGPLWSDTDRDAIRGFVNAGGGIVANHLATDIGAGEVSWDWWDGMGDSAIGSTMPGHPPSPQSGNIRVSDRNHVATERLPGHGLEQLPPLDAGLRSQGSGQPGRGGRRARVLDGDRRPRPRVHRPGADVRPRHRADRPRHDDRDPRRRTRRVRGRRPGHVARPGLRREQPRLRLLLAARRGRELAERGQRHGARLQPDLA